MDILNKDNRSPEQVEREKSQRDRAKDWAYTANHGVLCTITDPITDVPIGYFIQKMFGSQVKTGNIIKAEVIGDFGAVPLTIGMQRFFPGFMHSVSKLAEPVFKDAFESGARRDAKSWAIRHHHKVGSKEYHDRFERIYNYEVDHVSQAVMWTASSIALNVVAQKAFGNKASVSLITASKVGGAVLTAGLAVGARSIFPRKAEKLDKFIGDKLFIPIEDKFDDMVGNDKADSKQGWLKRVSADKGRRDGASPSMA